MLDAAGFIEEFHGLTGNLLKDRKRSLQALLEKYRPIANNENILAEIHAKLLPKTYLEETYKLEFLLYFKRVRELFEFVKNGNDKIISKIIRQKWFLTAILEDVSPQQFINDIFPQLSLVVRLKLLKQILKHFKDEKFIESLFQEILHTYGLRPALVIISGCSIERIKQVLKERGLKISMAQLKLLYDKDKSLIRFYFEEYHKRGGDMVSLDSFYRYLSRKDPDVFMELRIKYDYQTRYRLGRQATRRYIGKNKEVITKDPVKCLDLKAMKQSVLVRKLGDNFPTFLRAVFPESLNQLRSSHIVFQLLDDYPKRKRYTLFSSLFREVYNKDLVSAREIMTEELLETIPSHEEREKWVEVLENEVKYIPYKRSTLAIPELKELLFRADNVASRKELFDYIITCCGFNKDYNSLLDILKLICVRYRTDDAALLSVLEHIKKKMDLNKLTGEHWNYIKEIMLMQDFKHNSVDGEMVMEYCKFSYKSGQPFEELIQICIKSEEISDILNWKFIDKGFHDENFEKYFLTLILKNYPNMDEKHINLSGTMKMVFMIKRWNRNHHDDLIFASREKTIVEYIRKEVEHRWIYRRGNEIETLKYLICGENDTEDFANLYFENLTKLANYTITKWFLKNKPEIFENYIDKIYSCFDEEGKSLTRILKKLEYLGLVKSISNHYLEKLKEPDQTERNLIAQFLTSVLPTKNYLELLEKYIPSTEKLVLSEANDDEKTMLQIEISLAQSARFSCCQTEVLPIIFKYCKGDCLQPALHSLYSCFNRIPEKVLEPYLSELRNKPVSLRKHAIFLTALVFPVCVHNEFGLEIMKAERDISVKKHLFTSFYKYFLKNPLDQFWNILQQNMESLTIQDKESLDLISDVHIIPEKYKAIFAEKVWKIFEELEKNDKNAVNTYYEKFFNSIKDYDVSFLKTNFCTHIIRTKMFAGGLRRNSACSKFSIQFMMYGKDVVKAVENVMQILQQYKTKYWNSEEGAHAKLTLYQFCSELFNKAMDISNLRLILPHEFLLAFTENWKNTFTQQETFEEYLMLEFMLLKHTTNNNIEVIAQKISDLFEAARSTFGELVLDLFQEFMMNNMNLLLGYEKYEKKLMEFLKYFVEEDNMSCCRCILIISLLPSHIYISDDFEKNYDYVLSIIQSIQDPIIDIHLNKHFKS